MADRQIRVTTVAVTGMNLHKATRALENHIQQMANGGWTLLSHTMVDYYLVEDSKNDDDTAESYVCVFRKDE